MLPKVSLPKKKIKKYQHLITPELYEQITEISKSLQGLKVIHVNATSLGGGVAEILRSLVPLMKDVGLKAEWRTLPPDEAFFKITKKIHNILQGEQTILTKKEKDIYLNTNQELAGLLSKIKADLIVIHDPQPLPMISYLSRRKYPSILRFHIDLCNPQKNAWDFLFPFANEYDKIIFSVKDFCNHRFSPEKVKIFPPAIDPLVEKNKSLSLKSAKQLIENFEINTDKPLVTQVSRFDIWKDPLGVIKAYYLAKREVPDLQLALVGIFQAQDDPEAVQVFKKDKKYAKGDRDIFLFSDLKKLNVENDLLVNAFQAASDVILQKSIKEGFGLTVTEAMWKQKPVIAGNVGGIKLQINNGENGFLVNSPKQAGEKIVELIKHPKLREKLGKQAKNTVKERFLTPRLLRDYLDLFTELV